MTATFALAVEYSICVSLDKDLRVVGAVIEQHKECLLRPGANGRGPAIVEAIRDRCPRPVPPGASCP